MLEIRCSESGAVMRMRGMPSVCITAQRTPGEGWSKLMEDFTDLRKVLPENPAPPDSFGTASRLIAFLSLAPRLGV